MILYLRSFTYPNKTQVEIQLWLRYSIVYSDTPN